MATRAVTLFVNGPFPSGNPLAPGRLISSPASATPPILPPFVAGDVWNVQLFYYLGDGSQGNPFFNYRFPGSSTKLRLKARGNSTVYAEGASSSEIGGELAPPTVTRLNAGDSTHVARHGVTFDGTEGTFRIIVPAPNVSIMDMWSHTVTDHAYFASGTTDPIPAGASAAMIQDALNNSLTWRSASYANGHVQQGSVIPLSSVPATAWFRVTDLVKYSSFTIEYGTVSGGHNLWPWFLAAAEFDGSGLATTWGWNLSFPLDGNGHTFGDYFLAINKPAYLEVLLTQSGGAEALASETLLPSESEVPVFTSAPPGGGRVGTVYSFAYAGTHSPSFALTAGTLPNGLTLSPEGVLSGTPTVAGTFTGTVTATNAYGNATQNFSIVILPVLPPGALPPAITSGAPSNGRVGQVYSFTYTANQTAEFSLASGTLPGGLSLSTAGILSGTPTTAGTFTGTVAAINSAGTGTQNFSIIIDAAVVPTISPGILASHRNGDFNVLDFSDGPYLEDRTDEWPGLYIWHLPYCIDVDQYVATKPAEGQFESPWGYFWKDTSYKFIGDGVVEFERLRHNVPNDTVRAVSLSKAYQYARFTISGSLIVDMSILSFSRDIEANCYYHFALDDPGTLPVVPFIQIVPFLRSQLMTDLGTGFPTGVIAGVAGRYTDNGAASVLPGGSVEHVLGRLFCRKVLVG